MIASFIEEEELFALNQKKKLKGNKSAASFFPIWKKEDPIQKSRKSDLLSNKKAETLSTGNTKI
jgi:hypothetical protein